MLLVLKLSISMRLLQNTKEKAADEILRSCMKLQ